MSKPPAALAVLLVAAAPAIAGQTTPSTARAAPSPALQTRVDGLLAILDGTGDYDAYFAPTFRRQIPLATFAPLRDQLKVALGKPTDIVSTTPTGPSSADLVIGYERGTASATIAVDPAAPHPVTGLRITGTGVRGADSAAKLQADVAALPGRAGFGIWALDGGAPRLIAGSDVDRPYPLGSAFKLWVLTEAARQVAAGTRRWSDVAAVGAPSLGGTLGTWPRGAPVTLHTLATLMISVSDNSATDTLMATLGRERVDAVAVASAGAAAAPVLTTRELVLIKGDPALTRGWAAADRAGRVRLLAENRAAFDTATPDPAIFAAGKPVATDAVEWFASAAQMARVLDGLRGADATTHAILAVNPGVDAATAGRFAYLGYKGGSEPGVITMNYLVRTGAGRWLAVTGGWHRSDAEVPTLTFAQLMTRALVLAGGDQGPAGSIGLPRRY